MEEAAKYKVNPSITVISGKIDKEIIEKREPRGLFMVDEPKYIGIDNRTGDAWTEALYFVIDEYVAAIKKYPERRNSAHEALAYILEEVRELEQEVFKRQGDMDKMRMEAAHVVVTALRFITEVCKESDHGGWS